MKQTKEKSENDTSLGIGSLVSIFDSTAQMESEARTNVAVHVFRVQLLQKDYELKIYVTALCCVCLFFPQHTLSLFLTFPVQFFYVEKNSLHK